MFKLLLVCVLVAVAAAQTHHTKHPHATHTGHAHHTHPPRTTNVHESFHFFLDRADSKMLIKTHDECFVFSLNAKQLASVDTPTGVRDLEIKLVGMIGSGHQTPMKQADITKNISHHCGNNKIVSVTH